MNYTTYLLGAGASANSIPTIAELPKAFEDISSYIIEDIRKHKEDGGRHFETMEYEDLEQIASDIKKLAQLSIDYGTIDTYFKKLFLNNEKEESEKLKTALSYFFYLWQNCNCTFDRGKKKSWEKVDLRYLPLLSNILQVTDNKPKWNDKFKIVTWNYDFQIVNALKAMTSKDSKEIILDYNIYPLNNLLDTSANASNIVYLNGVSGVYQFENEIECRFDENLCTPVENIYELYSDYKNENNKFENLINFAWEWQTNSISSKAVEKAKEIFRNTSNLVIVGYSFPYYNFQIDKSLIKSLGKDIKITYQDFNAEIDGFVDKFGLEQERKNIKIHNDEKSNRQFIIPN